jgi:Na+-driven multidrug efflux pump
LRILLPGVVTLSIAKVLSGDLSGRGMPMYSTRAAIVALCLNVPLNFLLIPKWGISGAALASTISYSIQAAVLLYYFVNISPNGVFDTLVIKREDFQVYRRFVREQLDRIVLRGRP